MRGSGKEVSPCVCKGSLTGEKGSQKKNNEEPIPAERGREAQNGEGVKVSMVRHRRQAGREEVGESRALNGGGAWRYCV